MMMFTMRSRPFVLLIAASFLALTACKKNKDASPTPTPTPTPSGDTILKAVASFPIGIAIDYSLFKNNASYRNIVSREADQVTFGYAMKHGAIVKDDGSYDYSTADELLNLTNAARLQQSGHTL